MLKTLHKSIGALIFTSLATVASAQIAVPYTIDFSTITSQTEFIDSEWTVLDASEKTGKTWGPGSCYTDNGSITDIVTAKDYNSAYNDYLVSPAFKLEKGKTYTVKTLTALLSGLDMSLTLVYGTSNTDTISFKTIANLTPDEKGYNAEAIKTSEVKIDSTGNYYFAILAKGEAKAASARAHAFSFSIEEKEGGSETPDTPVETKTLPYAADFTIVNDEWTTIGDGTTGGTSWAYDADYGFYDKTTSKFYSDVKLSSGNDHPDYYVSPAFKFEEGKTYVVKTLTAFNNTKGALDLSVAIGTSATDSTTYSVIKKLTPFTDRYNEKKSEYKTFSVDKTGVYYLAFVGKTVDTDKSTVAHLFNFTVEEHDSAFTAPYSIDFSTVKSATDFIDSEWTVLDASEKTGKTWAPGSCYTDNGSITDIVTAKDYNSAYNDYLVSPAIKLEEGKTYTVQTLTALLSGLDMDLTLELGTSNTDTISFKTIATLTPEDKGYNAEAIKTTEVKVDSTGIYYFAILAKGEEKGASARAHAFLFSIDEKEGGDTPDTPVETTAIPYSVDFTSATDEWTTIGDGTTGGTSWAFEPEYGFYDKTTGKFFADVKLKSGNDHADYYVSPAFQLEAGKEYAVKTLTAFNNTKGALELSLAIGTSNTDSTTYTTIGKLTPLTDKYTEKKAELDTFTVEKSGVYYLAFVGKTVDADKSSIAHLFSFAIAENDGTLTTAIKNINTETVKKETIFNLNGQRVSKIAKGLYIVNGKKVFVK